MLPAPIFQQHLAQCARAITFIVPEINGNQWTGLKLSKLSDVTERNRGDDDKNHSDNDNDNDDDKW